MNPILRTIFLITTSILLFALHASAQVHAEWQDTSIVRPVPTAGWDSLRLRIEYNSLLLRAGLQGAYLAYVSVDTFGSVSAFRWALLNKDGPAADCATHWDSAFATSVEAAVRGASWTCGTANRRRVISTVSFPVIFTSRDHNEMAPLILNPTRKMSWYMYH
jgi:hypothetical protein